MRASPSLRSLKVILYAAFIGLLLASYLSPLQDIVEGRNSVATLQTDLQKVQDENTDREKLIEDLDTPEGVERAARERYGMIKPGEKVYIVPEDSEGE